MPCTEEKIHLLRSAMFAVELIAPDIEREGKEKESEQTGRNISLFEDFFRGSAN